MSDVCSSDLLEGCVIDDAGRIGKIEKPNDHSVRRVLDDLHQETHCRGNGDPEGLRQDDVGKCLQLGESQAVRGLPLRRRYRLDAASPYLAQRSEEHTSELQSLMRSSYAVFGLKKKTQTKQITHSQS